MLVYHSHFVEMEPVGEETEAEGRTGAGVAVTGVEGDEVGWQRRHSGQVADG